MLLTARKVAVAVGFAECGAGAFAGRTYIQPACDTGKSPVVEATEEVIRLARKFLAMQL